MKPGRFEKRMRATKYRGLCNRSVKIVGTSWLFDHRWRPFDSISAPVAARNADNGVRLARTAAQRIKRAP